MPSCALRTATLRPPTCERRPSEIARPAASSAARLMRKPLDSFSSDLLIAPCVTDRLRYELKASMFWLMRRPMVFPSWNVDLMSESLPGLGNLIGPRHGGLRTFGRFFQALRSKADTTVPGRAVPAAERLSRA